MFERVTTGLTVVKIKYLAKGSDLTFEEYLALFHNMLLYVLDELMSDLRIWINTKVAKATGQLRDSLIKNLESSRVKKGLMKLVLGTHLSYAKDVAEMTTSQVRHSGEPSYAYYYGAKGKIILDDPEAIGDYWNKLIDYAEERTMSILKRAIEEYFGGTGKLMKEVRGAI